jgi:hypothetical protein
MKFAALVLIYIMIQNFYQPESPYCIKKDSKIITSLSDISLRNSFFPEYKILPSDSSAVFKYQIKRNDISGKSVEEFVFEVKNESLNTFHFRDNEITKTQALYIYKDGNTFLQEEENFTLNSGFIRGEKLNDNIWDVSIDVEIWDPELNTNFRFTIEERFFVCE